MRPPDDLLTPDGDTGGALLRDSPEKYTHFRLRQTHDRSVSPSAQAPTDDYMGAVVASQFPSRCDRLLLIEDDLAGQGLGVTAHFLAIALLNAMRTGRVLLEVAVNPRWGPTNMSIPYRKASAGASTPTLPSARPRWCSRPPYTHQCFYQPWSNCTAGNTSLHQSPRLGQWNGLPGHALLPGGTPIVRIKLSGLYITPHHARVMGPAYGAAMRFLFRPREWVKHLGRCVLRRDGLVSRSFISVFIRHSVEKSTETRSFRYKMPVIDDYAASAEALSRAIQMQRVHIQTSSPVALANFTLRTTSLRLAARGPQLTLSYTDNPRSEHDTWGGWQKDKDETMDGTVAAVQRVHCTAGRCAHRPTALLLDKLSAHPPSVAERFQSRATCREPAGRHQRWRGGTPDKPHERRAAHDSRREVSCGPPLLRMRVARQALKPCCRHGPCAGAAVGTAKCDRALRNTNLRGLIW